MKRGFLKRIFFTSDLHLGDLGMIRKLGRPFSSVEDMNKKLIENINLSVEPDDVLYILGDISNRIGRDASANIIRNINCKNLYLIKGNNDKDYSRLDLFKSIEDYREFKHQPSNTRFCLFHFPIRNWAGQRGGSVQLHGHIHSKGSRYNTNNFERKKWQYDVGVDANNYSPVNIEQIIDLIEQYSK